MKLVRILLEERFKINLIFTCARPSKFALPSVIEIFITLALPSLHVEKNDLRFSLAVIQDLVSIYVPDIILKM